MSENKIDQAKKAFERVIAEAEKTLRAHDFCHLCKKEVGDRTQHYCVGESAGWIPVPPGTDLKSFSAGMGATTDKFHTHKNVYGYVETVPGTFDECSSEYCKAHCKQTDSAKYEENKGIGAGRFLTKDSGERAKFEGGMQRDTTIGKVRPDLCFDGPMFMRWAELMTRGAFKYEARNWMKASGRAEMERFCESAVRHFVQWYFRLNPEEDHAAAIFFNINGVEYLRSKGE